MIGDALDYFVDVDMSYKVIGDKSVAHILVFLDIREGLMGDICLGVMEGPFLQLLDYEEVLFRFHALDHLVAHNPHKMPMTHPSKRVALSEQTYGVTSDMSPRVVKLQQPVNSRAGDEPLDQLTMADITTPVDPSSTLSHATSFSPVSFISTSFSSSSPGGV